MSKLKAVTPQQVTLFVATPMYGGMCSRYVCFRDYADSRRLWPKQYQNVLLIYDE